MSSSAGRKKSEKLQISKLKNQQDAKTKHQCTKPRSLLILDFRFVCHLFFVFCDFQNRSQINNPAAAEMIVKTHTTSAGRVLRSARERNCPSKPRQRIA